MPISQNLMDNYDTYSRKYLRVIKNIFDCDNCTNECIDNTIYLNYIEHVVDNLSECPCFLENQLNIGETSANKIHGRKESEETPIYEKLAVGEALIISRDEDNNVLVAENHDGEVEFRQIKSSWNKVPDK